ncbi:tRNA-dihydrouridine synthase, partial [Campylobacter jejuni]
IHGRTRKQLYSGKADYGSIASAKASVKIPVIANGDINAQNAKFNDFKAFLALREKNIKIDLNQLIQ